MDHREGAKGNSLSKVPDPGDITVSTIHYVQVTGTFFWGERPAIWI